MWTEYAISWVINFVVIALATAVADEFTHKKIEKQPAVAAFLIFALPTLLELFSYVLARQPFLQNLF